MTNKTNHGGHREGSGRKPSETKMIPIKLTIDRQTMDDLAKLGGTVSGGVRLAMKIVRATDTWKILNTK